MPNAIVVGAGPAGALLAYLLARRGVPVTLLERQTDFSREFRGEVLMPSGIAALHEAGLRQQLGALPSLSIRTVEIFRGERRVVAIPVDGFDSPPRVVPQPAMLEMFVAEATKFPGFKLERGVTVRDLIYEKDRVAGVHADTLEGPRDYRGDFVIACDGRASAIRKHSALPQDRIMQGFDVVWGHVPGHFLDGRTARGYIGNGHLLIIYPSPEGHMQIGWVIDKGTFGDLKKIGADGWIGALAPHVSPDLRNFLVANKNRPGASVLARRRLRSAARMDRARIAPDRRRGASDVSGRSAGNQRRAARCGRRGQPSRSRAHNACRRGHARFCGPQYSGRAMARDRHATGHAAGRTALRGVEFAPQPHRRQRANDRVRENFPRRLPRAPTRSVPERRHPRRNGAVIALSLRHLAKEGFPHDSVTHSRAEYVRGRVHTQSHRIVLVAAQARHHRELPQSVKEIFAFVSQ
jgi:2-polyprenyl-6-methoxyphenol hydroxylase-like FAD-dependent oxidoreductase